jgi:hypothetical protein
MITESLAEKTTHSELSERRAAQVASLYREIGSEKGFLLTLCF